ncbi:solute carrier family 23 member 2-like [Styela clava]
MDGEINPTFEETEDHINNEGAASDFGNKKIRENGNVPAENHDKNQNKMIYEIDESPRWHVCIILGIQHCLLAVGGLVGMPLIIGRSLCMFDDDVGYVGRAMVINAMLFISGIVTFIQTTFGSRLPIMQGGSSAFLPATLAILSLPHNRCPSAPINNTDLTNGTVMYNDTDGTLVDGAELWQRRMREIQGALAVAAVLEILLAMTGVVGFLMRFIGPLTVAPSITLIGLSLLDISGYWASGQWGITIFTIALLVVFSQYLKDIKVPFPWYSRTRGCFVKRSNFFKMFPVLLAVILGVILCVILTATGALPSNPSEPGYRGRTDTRIRVLYNSPWFQFSYPGQWGLPVVTASGVIGMLVAVIISMVESIGDYYACARIAGAPPPPKHAVNRGLAIEGLGTVLSGLIGTSTGTTSYTQNIGALGITQVASRRVLQVAGIVFFIFGMLGKFGAVVVLIPDPVMAGLFCVVFGMVTAVGISNLQFVDLNSARNLFIIGFSLFMGLMVPRWVASHRNAIDTGEVIVDQIFLVLLETPVFVGFVLGVFFDNTMPGTLKERGMLEWRKRAGEDNASEEEREKYKKEVAKCYNLPFSTNFRFARYIPILPEFNTKPPKTEKEDKVSAVI